MTRRAGTSSAETKALILETAAKEFAEKGYQKASLRAICSDAGLTTGAMYFFFKSKEDLFESIIMPASEEIERITSYIIEIEFSALDGSIDQDDYVAMYADTIGRRIFALATKSPQATKAIVRNKDHDVVMRQRRRLVEATKDAFSKKREELHNDAINSRYSDEVANALINVSLDVIMYSLEAVANDGASQEQIATVLSFMRGGLKAVANA